MRVTGACLSTAALAAGFVGVAWASISENEQSSARPGKSSYTPQNRLDGQKIVVGATPAGDAAGNKKETTPELEDANEATADSIQKILVTTTTSETAVTVTYPKITEAPSLFKRKLGSSRWDLIHEGIQGQKRDATSCPVDYQLCPKSVGGGCCPNDRLCDTSSCLPTTPGPSTACGQVGYVACGQDDGGGCCPGGYVCGQAGCSPSAGVSATETCGANSYLCPASLNYGCCKNGMGCALKGCYTTSIQTYTLTSTLTTTDASSHAVTITTAIQAITTPVAPTATASTEGNLIPKVQATPTAIAKTPASGTPNSSSGLTTAEIGGIIGGAVAFLVIILIIAFFILRRLNTAIKAASDRQSRTSSSQARSGRSRPRAANTPDIDAMSVDPLMITGSESGSNTRHGSYQASMSSVHEVDASPPTFMSPFSPRSPPHTHYPRGYNPVATSESAHSNASSGYRNPSLESTPPMTQIGRGGYFDIPLRSDRNSQGSLNRRPSQHGRNWSNASEESEVSAASSGPVELDGNPERKYSFQSALQRIGMGRMVSGRRRPSDSPVLTGGPTSNPPAYPSPTSPPLGHIPEAGESRDHIDVAPPPHPGMSGLTGVQLREAGLSNSQLREMTLFEHGPYPPEKTGS